jgi:hypothetical protein
VSPGFFTTLKVPLIKGPELTEQDGAVGPQVVIVDEEMVKRYRLNADPIGKRVTFNKLAARPVIQWMTVVGVVAQYLKHEGLDAENRVQSCTTRTHRRGFIGNSMSFAAYRGGDPTPVHRRPGGAHGSTMMCRDSDIRRWT